MSIVKVLIADDQPLIRDGLAAILSMEEEYSIVAKTGDGLSTIAQVQFHQPDLVLMDIHMPKLDGLEATKRIKNEFPDIKILILTTFEDEEYILQALLHGASGFLVKGSETDKILSTIQDCLNGRINFPHSIQLRLIQGFHSFDHLENPSSKETNTHTSPEHKSDEKWNRLSVQERNILKKLKQGKSNLAIASELYITTGTVKNYLSSIYKKLEVSNRTEAITYLYENGH